MTILYDTTDFNGVPRMSQFISTAYKHLRNIILCFTYRKDCCDSRFRKYRIKTKTPRVETNGRRTVFSCHAACTVTIHVKTYTPFGKKRRRDVVRQLSLSFFHARIAVKDRRDESNSVSAFYDHRPDDRQQPLAAQHADARRDGGFTRLAAITFRTVPNSLDRVCVRD